MYQIIFMYSFDDVIYFFSYRYPSKVAKRTIIIASLQFNLATKKLVVTTKSNYKRWSKQPFNNQQESRVALKLGDQVLTYLQPFLQCSHTNENDLILFFTRNKKAN